MTQLTPDSCPDCSPIRLQIPLNCISQVSVVLGVHLLLVPVLTLTPFQGKLKSLGGRTPRREDSNLQMPWRQAWPPLWPLSLSAQDPMKRDLGFSHTHPQSALPLEWSHLFLHTSKSSFFIYEIWVKVLNQKLNFNCPGGREQGPERDSPSPSMSEMWISHPDLIRQTPWDSSHHTASWGLSGRSSLGCGHGTRSGILCSPCMLP